MADMTRLDFHFRFRKQIIILLGFLLWKKVKTFWNDMFMMEVAVFAKEDEMR